MSRWHKCIEVGAHEGSVTAAVAALREALRDASPGAKLQVCFSDAWARYKLLPWRADLHLEAAWQAYAQQVFANAAMPLTEGWTLMLLPLRYGAPRLAVAVKSELMTELMSCKAAALAVTTKFLDVLHAVPTPATNTVGVLDEGRLTLARLQAGALQAVQSLRFNAAVDAPQALARQRQMLGGDAPLLLYAQGDEAQALRHQGLGVIDLDSLRAPQRGAIDVPLPAARNAQRAQVAVALLLPIVGVAMLLAVLRYQCAQWAAHTEALAVSAPEHNATLVATESARAEAQTVAHWLWPQWEGSLNAVQAAWPADFRATRVQVEAARGVLHLEATAPDLTQISAWAAQVPGATVTQISVDAARRSESVRFELNVPWGLQR